MEIKINKEIRNYTESMYFGLSLRQFIFSILACIFAVGFYFIFRPYFGLETLSWLCILSASPFAALGFITYNGMHCLLYTSREEYNQRLEQVENLLNINLTEKEEMLHNYEVERVTIKNKSLHEIITRDNIDSIFSVTSINEIGELTDFNDIKSSEYFDLLKYLIRYGYIDETYSDYMTSVSYTHLDVYKRQRHRRS